MKSKKKVFSSNFLLFYYEGKSSSLNNHLIINYCIFSIENICKMNILHYIHLKIFIKLYQHKYSNVINYSLEMHLLQKINLLWKTINYINKIFLPIKFYEKSRNRNDVRYSNNECFREKNYRNWYSYDYITMKTCQSAKIEFENFNYLFFLLLFCIGNTLNPFHFWRAFLVICSVGYSLHSIHNII